jgi:hypothetical protein
MMITPAPTLRDLQHAVMRSIVAGDDAEAVAHVVASGLDASRRLAVYRNTFESVLIHALRLTYPVVHRLVADDCFDAAARRFVHDAPPRCANLDDYGDGFAEFLARFAPIAELAYLPDVARLEWAVSRSLHAPEVEPLDLARLVGLTEYEQARLRFTPRPSAMLVQADHPVDTIWRAVLAQDDTTLAAIDPSSEPVWLLVHRAELGIDVLRLSEAAWRFTAALFSGSVLHAALASFPSVDAQAALANHLAHGTFVGFAVDDPPIT